MPQGLHTCLPVLRAEGLTGKHRKKMAIAEQGWASVTTVPEGQEAVASLAVQGPRHLRWEQAALARRFPASSRESCCARKGVAHAFAVAGVVREAALLHL